MSTVVALLYTTIGGVLGAALNQYVTHIRDRRTARAVVIERLQDVEISIVESRWPENPATTVSDLEKRAIRLEKLLAVLESACLIAGIPRAAVALYASSCRLYEGAKRIRFHTDETIDVLEGMRSSPLASGEYDEERIAKIMALNSTRITLLTNTERSADKQRDLARDLLGRVIWHPSMILTRRRMFSKVEKTTRNLERNQREAISINGFEQQLIAELEQAPRSTSHDQIPND